MRVVITLANGTRVPLEGPFQIDVFEKGDVAPLARYDVEVSVQKGGSSSARSSGGGVSVAAAYNGVILGLNVKPIR